MGITIPEGGTVLFQGDSITDCGRSRANDEHLGGGYAGLVAAWHSADQPRRKVRFLNRGLSGNRVKDLQARWRADCLDLQPNIVSILIGVNDVWRRYDSNDPTSREAFEAGYRGLLSQTRDTLDASILLLEPFVLHTLPDRESWHEDLDPKRQVVAALAEEFGATFIPLQRLFDDAAEMRGPAFWAGDGVHPTQAGHALIAQAWLSVFEC